MNVDGVHVQVDKFDNSKIKELLTRNKELDSKIEGLKMEHCFLSIDELLDIYQFGIKDDPYMRDTMLFGALVRPIFGSRELSNEQKMERITTTAMKMVLSCEKILGVSMEKIEDIMRKKLDEKSKNE